MGFHILLWRNYLIWRPILLRAWGAFLPKNATVKTQYLPFKLEWVSHFYALVNEPLSTRLNKEQKRQFLSNMWRIGTRTGKGNKPTQHCGSTIIFTQEIRKEWLASFALTKQHGGIWKRKRRKKS
jgi:hypothetical protein